MVHDKTGPDRKKLDRRNARQQPIKFKDSGFRTGKMLKKKIKDFIFHCYQKSGNITSTCDYNNHYSMHSKFDFAPKIKRNILV